MNEHLIVEVNEEKGYKKVYCTEGHFLTDWDKEDILNFNSGRIMFCPINTDIDGYWCLTDEENAVLEKQKFDKIREIEEEKRNKVLRK